jgi:uncharacterized protein
MAAGGSTSSGFFQMIDKYKYMNLTTFRKNGKPVVTPVWFAEADNRLFMYTDPESGKVKRLRHTSHVTVQPCTVNGKPLGDTVEARGRLLTDEAEWRFADRQLKRKYGLQKSLYEFIPKLMKKRHIYIEISAV